MDDRTDITLLHAWSQFEEQKYVRSFAMLC